ncbi:MAG: hypothetical protein HMLKMBBP_03105 [Planctomycetes bacterium]|nr:hypothetical protein [Planctomycetota bacterium]
MTVRRLRLVTWNIHRGRGSDRVLDVARIGRELRAHGADVACVQEIVANRRLPPERSQARLIAEATGFPHAAVGLNCVRPEGVYGNATFSRHPFAAAENVDLSVRFQIHRGALWTAVDAGGVLVHILNAHLGFAGLEQRAQFRRAIDFLDDAAGASAPVVFLGDTNDWRHRLHAAAIARGFAPAIGSAEDPGPATFPSTAPLGALDKIFVRGPVRVVRAHVTRTAAARAASDHLPVVADLEVGRA